MLLQLEHIQKSFRTGGAQISALQDVSMNVGRNEIVGIVGESGSGKSTLARVAQRLINADAGNIVFEGEDITRKDEAALGYFRRSVQMVFQNPLESFNPRIKTGDALREICAFYKFTAAQTQAKLENLIIETGLNTDVLSRLPSELSGGQLQRLAIARALISDPRLIFADEPVSALDVSVQAQLLNLFHSLRERFSLAMVFISHDISVIEHLCSRAIVMRKGRIVEEGALPELFLNPHHDYTKELIESAPKIA